VRPHPGVSPELALELRPPRRRVVNSATPILVVFRPEDKCGPDCKRDNPEDEQCLVRRLRDGAKQVEDYGTRQGDADQRPAQEAEVLRLPLMFAPSEQDDRNEKADAERHIEDDEIHDLESTLCCGRAKPDGGRQPSRRARCNVNRKW
jgi:hypothetical protein